MALISPPTGCIPDTAVLRTVFDPQHSDVGREAVAMGDGGWLENTVGREESTERLDGF